MTSIMKIFKENKTGPYSLGVKVKVVARDNIQSYKKDGEDKSVLTCAVSDGEEVMKVICYDKSKFTSLRSRSVLGLCGKEVGANIILREFIRKNENGERFMVCTSSTKIVMCVTPVDVREELVTMGQNIVNPPPPATIPISSALASPLRKRVSVTGKIIQEDEPRTVEVKGEQVSIKTITVEDGSGKSRITLWRDTSTAEVRPGDHVLITDVVVNMYQNKASLSTTSRTKLEKCDAPIEEVVITVEGMYLNDSNVELYTESEECLSVPKDMFQAALSQDGEINLENLCSDEPMKIQVKRCGSEVLSVLLL